MQKSQYVDKFIVKDNNFNLIPIYDLERTICDLIRSKSSIEVQDFNAVDEVPYNQKEAIKYGSIVL